MSEKNWQQYSSWHRLQSLRNSHALSVPTSVSLPIKNKAVFCIHSCIVSLKELKNRRFNMQGIFVLWKSNLKALKKNLRASKRNLRALKMTARGS